MGRAGWPVSRLRAALSARYERVSAYRIPFTTSVRVEQRCKASRPSRHARATPALFRPGPQPLARGELLPQLVELLLHGGHLGAQLAQFIGLIGLGRPRRL